MKGSFNVNCMMCGRASGVIRLGVFHRHPGAPPLIIRAGRSHCGYCRGNVYLEAEDSPVVPRPVDITVERRTRRAS